MLDLLLFSPLLLPVYLSWVSPCSLRCEALSQLQLAWFDSQFLRYSQPLRGESCWQRPLTPGEQGWNLYDPQGWLESGSYWHQEAAGIGHPGGEGGTRERQRERDGNLLKYTCTKIILHLHSSSSTQTKNYVTNLFLLPDEVGWCMNSISRLLLVCAMLWR